jgi:large subunit ribosomal protein L33
MRGVTALGDVGVDRLQSWPQLAAERAVPRLDLSTDPDRIARQAEMAKGGKKKAETVFLVCEETGDYNYSLRRKPGGEKLKLKKYSPRLRKHTVHVEKKK